MNSMEISRTVDASIAEEELPVRPRLKVIRKNDPDYRLSEHEIEDRNEFIRCYIFQAFELLLLIPKQAPEGDFCIVDVTVEAEEYSAFNTHIFQRQLRPFNRYHYAVRKILERVKDLAIMQSCIISPEGRQEAYRR